MSYDIRLSVFSVDGVSAEGINAAYAILDQYGGQPSGQSNCYSTRWPDGSGFAIYSRSLFEASEPFSALLNPLGDLSLRFCNFAFDFALATGCVIRPDVIPPLVLVANMSLADDLPTAITEKATVHRVSSGIAVRNALAPSYYGWRGAVQKLVHDLNDTIRDTPENGA